MSLVRIYPGRASKRVLIFSWITIILFMLQRLVYILFLRLCLAFSYQCAVNLYISCILRAQLFSKIATRLKHTTYKKVHLSLKMLSTYALKVDTWHSFIHLLHFKNKLLCFWVKISVKAWIRDVSLGLTVAMVTWKITTTVSLTIHFAVLS